MPEAVRVKAGADLGEPTMGGDEVVTVLGLAVDGVTADGLRGDDERPEFDERRGK